MDDRGKGMALFSNLKPVNCHHFSLKEDVVVMNSRPGQDHFNMPGLHVSDSLSRCIMEKAGDFTFSVKSKLFSQSKFDGAGIYFENGMHRLKFGVEHYGSGVPRIVCVKSSPYSDESNGSILASGYAHLFVSRLGDIVSCYIKTCEGMRFERAFCELDLMPGSIIGLYVQSPFSDGLVQGRFTNMVLVGEAIEHFRG